MKRTRLNDLKLWISSNNRKPLVLRGARQVGKTWLVRMLGKECGFEVLELNFERNPEFVRLFSNASPRKIYDDITLQLDRQVSPERALLFLDEIQAAPELISKLRWFYEEMPELRVIAAGSLLEFALADMSHSMPVGRIRYGFLEPLNFEEYLLAHGQAHLWSRWDDWSPDQEISEVLHQKTLDWFDLYQMTGGMPEVVAAEIEGATAQECRQLQTDLLQTYRDDFAKYTGRMDPRILNAVLMAAVRSMGKKFIYSHAGEDIRHRQAKHAIELLAQSRLCTLIPHTHANGLPLGAEVNERLRKVGLLDVGLAHALWNTPAGRRYPNWRDLNPQIRGSLVEQIVAQQLRTLSGSFGIPGEIYHWRREGGRSGEIDYVIELNGRILPIEVKSGAAGSMKSLHQFMFDKNLSLAVRLDRNPPSRQTIQMATTQGDPVEYVLLNLPYYLVQRLPEMLAKAK
ncbi:MAG: ATP-binding protein [Verrucomicrobia bacterium]|nr:ATP-binding protein [Verrucomicrobiota bacterium]MCH8514362.1 AAA family ATPase [Kiritimatiellia bacterium]